MAEIVKGCSNCMCMLIEFMITREVGKWGLKTKEIDMELDENSYMSTLK